ncbi:MAG: imelysin family protein [Sedimenticolaceae bacterium]
MNRILMLVAGLALNMPLHAATTDAVLDHYADLAHAMYSDALTGAQALQQQVDAFLARPTEQNLAAARTAWVAARHPYQQTEAYRFGNPIVDDWEGKVNAWPLDEGLIDYTAASYGGESDENPLYTANVIANRTLTVGGRTVDASRIDKALLSQTLHEIDEVETNVATGYHAIEFLLWGQDLNGTGPGAGARPASDYDPVNCSWGNCDRRADYLRAVTGLLVDELQWMVDQWTDGGEARRAVTTGDLERNLATIFTGMGSLSYGELAGERMKLGLMLHDPEEEHDCFSDNTHWSHYDDALGIRNVYTGAYTRIDGSVLSGPSLSDLVAARDAAADRALRDHLDATMAAMQVLVDTAQGGEAYDQMIGERNTSGNAKVKAAVDALVAQTRAIEKAVNAMGLGSIAFEGSDSLDAPEKVN